MNIQLIALDLDGTALNPDHLTVSCRLQKVLKRAHQQGILVVPVTGRPYRLLPNLLLEHPIWESFAVLCNGAQVRDLRTGEILSNHLIEKDFLSQVLDIVEAYDLPVEFNSDGRLYHTRHTLSKELLEPRLLFHCTFLLPKSGVLVDSLRDCCDLEVEKVHINCIPPEQWEAVQQDLQKLDVSVVCEKPPNLEVTHRHATKGQGLQLLCDRLGIPLDNVLAIGDSGNDLTMFEAAGISVAMGSAPEHVRAAADYSTGTNLEDGAADAILRFAF